MIKFTGTKKLNKDKTDYILPVGAEHYFEDHPTDDTLAIFIADVLPVGVIEYVEPEQDINVSIKDFLNLLGFAKVTEIEAIISANTPESQALKASKTMMEVRDSVTVNSRSMGMYYQLLKSLGVLVDADITLLNQGKPLV